MKSLTSKLTLYDTLGLLVPGFVILWWICPAEKCCSQFVSYNWAWVTILSYTIGLIYHRIIECFMHISGMRRNTYMLRNAWRRARKDEDFPLNFQREYDLAYTRLAKHNCLFSIPVLEAQEIFLRNSILLIIGSMIKLAYDKAENLYIVLLFALFLLTIIFWFQSLHKIYYAVWDSDKCLDAVNKEV